MKDLGYRFSDIGDRLKEIIDKKDIITFGYTIESEIIHLVYLLKNGDLNYNTFINGNWTMAQIGKFDTTSNYYNQLDVLYIKGKLNIFYAYSNYINSNIFTLHHVVYKNTIESRYNIIRYLSKKSSKASFTVDFDTIGNIHLLYNTIVNDLSYVYYTYFNPHKNSWLKEPIKLSQENKFNENSHVFVDSKDNIHAIWWEEYENGYTLKYHRLSPTGKDRFKWIDMKNLNIKSSIPKGVLTEEEDLISLVYGDEINYSTLTSSDYGLNWKRLEDRIKPHNIEQEITSQENVDVKEQVISTEEINIAKIDQIFANQKELKMLLNNILEELIFIKSKIIEIEENSQKGSFLKKIFN